MADLKGMGGERGIQGMRMGGDIIIPLKMVCCHQSEVSNENNSRSFEQLLVRKSFENVSGP
jgi:hypothetical protein